MKRKSVSYAKYGYIFSIPFVVAFLLFSLYPTLYTAFLGFTDTQGPAMWGQISFAITEEPFSNFLWILQNNTFQNAIRNTFFIWAMNFIPQLGLALLLAAWFTSKRSKLRGQGLFKIFFYMPNIITAAALAILFHSLFMQPGGPINFFLTRFGFIEQEIDFMVRPFASQAIVAFIQFWMWYGYTMLILIAGINGISPDIYEASEIDGASSIQTFFRITLPNLKSIMLFTLVTSFIGGLNMFDIPHLFNFGGPVGATTTVGVFIMNLAFSGRNFFNRAGAASMIIFILIAIISIGIFYLLRDKDEIAERKAKKQLEKSLKAKGGVKA